MEQLICHLIGDYVLQNHWMANNKKTSWVAAIVHGLAYSLPFLLLTWNPWTLLVIFATHVLIDHFGMAGYWVDFWGTGKEGWLLQKIYKLRGYAFSPAYTAYKDEVLGDVKKPAEWVKAETEYNEDGSVRMHTAKPDAPRILATPDAPAFLGIWLLIIVDNTMHLTINYLALTFLG